MTLYTHGRVLLTLHSTQLSKAEGDLNKSDSITACTTPGNFQSAISHEVYKNARPQHMHTRIATQEHIE